MKVCNRHEGTVLVYSSVSCPLCGAWEILKAADQKMSSAIGMITTVRRAMEKDSEGYFLSTLEVAADFIGEARQNVDRVMDISSGSADIGEEVGKFIEEDRSPKK